MTKLINKHKKEYITRSREFFKLTSPIFLEQTFIVMMGIITTIMVSTVGAHALAAVSMVDPISHLVAAFFNALTIGATIVVAQYTGRGDTGKSSGVAAQAILLAVGLGVALGILIALFRSPIVNFLFRNADQSVLEDSKLFLGLISLSFPAMAVMMTAFGVLRGSGNTKAPMVITILINIINVVLGLNLIPHLGVVGAALALVSSRYVGAILGMIYLLKKSQTIRFSIRDFTPNFEVQRLILRFGIPTTIESGTFQFGKLIITVFVAGMGTAAIAANAVVSSISSILNSPGSAFSTGATILVGQRIGRGDVDDVRKTTYFAVITAALTLTVICIVTFFLLDPIISLYYVTPEMLAIMRPVLITLVIAMPTAWPPSFVTPGAVRATGDVKYAMVVAITSMLLIRVAFAYILGVHFGLGILGVWLSMYADWILRGICFVSRIAGSKWQGKAVVK